MVYYFELSCGRVLFMGKDKYENEELIRFGTPEQVWFHVANLSSAHVYLQLKPGEKMKDILDDDNVLIECASMVKANSIEGCKKSEVWVNYTNWRNLKKDSSMQAGAVSFHDKTRVFDIKVCKNNSIVNRINKSKKWEEPDLSLQQQECVERIRKEANEKNRLGKEQLKEKKRLAIEKRKLKAFVGMMDEKNMQMFGGSVDDSAAKQYEEEGFM